MNDITVQLAEGIRLFNEGLYFECHEALESIWLLAEGVEKERLHALILAAVSLHHLCNGNLKGAQSVGSRAIAKLAMLQDQVMGMKISISIPDFEMYLNAAGTGLPAPGIGWVNR